MKANRILSTIAAGAALIAVGIIACKNPVMDKVKDIAASGNAGLSLSMGSAAVAAGGSCIVGSTALSTTIYSTFTISNSGKDDLKASVAASGNFSVSSQPPSSISSGKSSSFVIAFTPTSPEGVKNGTITVSSNDPDNKSLRFAVSGVGSTIMLPRTGQTMSYAAGDDGDLQIGAAWPATRFTGIDADNCVDNLTGLMWLKDPNPYGAANWASALSSADSATNDGYGNWRIPNRTELLSLIDYSKAAPNSTLTSQGFNYNLHSVQGIYWTSTSNTSPTSIKWYVDFSTGSVSNDISTAAYYCWLVRSSTSDKVVSLPRTGSAVNANANEDGASQAGAAWPSPRFQSRGDGTMSDLLTGLRWQASPSTTKLSWTNALGSAAALSAGTARKWRLPNINELNSIINIGAPIPATWLNSQGFSNIQQEAYWTSTAYASTLNWRWFIDLSTGSASGEDRAALHYVILVRSE